MSRTPDNPEHHRSTAVEVDDRTLAGYLAAQALVEIRFMATTALQKPEPAGNDKVLERIRFLAHLAHNLPLVAFPRPSSGAEAVSPREKAMEARPMSWTWNTSTAQGRRWILTKLAQSGYQWTPPEPLPTATWNAAM